MEQIYTVDDNCLPSPQELAAYKQIDPRIVEYLIDASVKEQNHRHKMDEKKLKILAKADGRIGRMNWWGMFFCFLVFGCIVGCCGISFVFGQAVAGSYIGWYYHCYDCFYICPKRPAG